LFKVNQSAILRRDDGKILVLKQNDWWLLPGGRLENDESSEEGFLREIEEETGIKDCIIKNILNVGISDSGRTYLVIFLCTTAEEDVRLSDEHSEYKWIELEEIEDYMNFQFNTKMLFKDVLKNI